MTQEKYEYSIEGSQHFDESYEQWKHRNSKNYNTKALCRVSLNKIAVRNLKNVPSLLFFLTDNNGNFVKFCSKDINNYSSELLNEISSKKYEKWRVTNA